MDNINQESTSVQPQHTNNEVSGKAVVENKIQPSIIKYFIFVFLIDKENLLFTVFYCL